MLEWLLTIGATELGKAVFEQGLKLGQAAAEDYVKDFFKGCLKEGVAAAKPEVAKKAVAQALQAFLLLVTDELEDQELSKAEIRDRYDAALIQFVKNAAVKPVLGQAFEKDCTAIDHAALATLWEQSTLQGKSFPAMPEGFDWPRIGSEYLKKVRRIVRETPELRSLLETALLEDIARNTAKLNTQISPGFDVAKYRESLQSSYGYLKLSTIDTTDQHYRVKLWSMFIEQTVREDIQQTSEVSEEALEHARREYFQQPSRKVLSVVGALHAMPLRAVILGDPGAGKSTLLQYLALEWVESQTSEVSARLPLLIELREYAIAQTDSFLDFLHRGRGVDWQFDQQQLHQYLQEHPTLVMFDGLDEVFDRPTQAAITDDIIRFAHQYPHAQILITSRIIGYSPERLQHSGFRHFTIQPLDTDEIHAFIDRWYTLALGNDPDKPRLVTRLKDAIANSTAIQNLADNPLLLTMMAILNRRQELPRDRADLYDQASRVLLYHWDVDHKKLNLPLDTIGRREKQEMLRLIAYEMQTSEEGLKGNLISADRLIRILTDYLRDQGFSEPREKANKLIDQLRHRNFILCDRGADTYGFVHRTFLEYFCAVEIVNRFEKQRTLTFEQLRDEVFGNHWQDETWHEVLRLICGMIDAKFTGELVEFLITQKVNRQGFIRAYGDGSRLESKGLSNLLLASDCFSELKNYQVIYSTKLHLLNTLKYEAQKPEIRLSSSAASDLVNRIAICGQDETETLRWLMRQTTNDVIDTAEQAVIKVVAHHYHCDNRVLPWLQNCLKSNKSFKIRWSTVNVIARYYWGDNQTFPLLLERAQIDLEPIRNEAMTTIAKYYVDHPETLLLLQDRVQNDTSGMVRGNAVRAISQYYWSRSNTLDLIKDKAENDSDAYVRRSSLNAISEHYNYQIDIFYLLCRVAIGDPFIREKSWEINPRQKAIQVLLTHHPTLPETLELLRDRAENDPDEQLRQWAQEQLKMQNVELETEDTP